MKLHHKIFVSFKFLFFSYYKFFNAMKKICYMLGCPKINLGI